MVTFFAVLITHCSPRRFTRGASSHIRESIVCIVTMPTSGAKHYYFVVQWQKNAPVLVLDESGI
jgi:hypothetical protein